MAEQDSDRARQEIICAARHLIKVASEVESISRPPDRHYLVGRAAHDLRRRIAAYEELAKSSREKEVEKHEREGVLWFDCPASMGACLTLLEEIVDGILCRALLLDQEFEESEMQFYKVTCPLLTSPPAM
jgi:hypothetical protein